MKSVNFCEDSGAMKACSEAQNPDVQKLCEFYDKSTSFNHCTWLRFGEFCTCPSNIPSQNLVIKEEVKDEDEPAEEGHKQKHLPYL